MKILYYIFLVGGNVRGCPGQYQIVIVPRSASIAIGEQFEFSAVGLTATGDTIERADLDLDLEWKWWSTDPNVFNGEPSEMVPF